MINIEERINRLETLLSSLASLIKTDIRVALPAKVTSFDATKQTISCVPTIRELVNINGVTNFQEIPELRDVPISLPRAGNWAVTLPISIGDECMVVFQDLCLDGWWSRGGIQNWNDLRRHDLSDAIAIFSPWSQPNALSNYNTSSLEVRDLSGNTKMTFSQGEVTLIGNLKINGNVDIDGTLDSTGTITSQSDVVAGTISGKTHTHSGVTSGSSNTGVPNA